MMRLFVFLLVSVRSDQPVDPNKDKLVNQGKPARVFDTFYPDDAIIDMVDKKIYKPTLSLGLKFINFLWKNWSEKKPYFATNRRHKKCKKNFKPISCNIEANEIWKAEVKADQDRAQIESIDSILIREVNQSIFFGLRIHFGESFYSWFWFILIHFESQYFILIRFVFDSSPITIHPRIMIHLRIKIKLNQKSKVGQSWFTHLRIIGWFDFDSKRIKVNRGSSWFEPSIRSAWIL